jgi:prepilin-type N-terminal cleavage/methylation domain-containing protein
MRRRGFTLVEVMIAVCIVIVLAAQCVYRYTLAAEITRVDTACATLRSIWVAERLYRMEHPGYAAHLADLSAMGLIESRLGQEQDPFIYTIESADQAGFVAHATRHGAGSWAGSLTIDQTGELTGSIDGPEGEHVTPPVQ